MVGGPADRTLFLYQKAMNACPLCLEEDVPLGKLEKWRKLIFGHTFQPKHFPCDNMK